MKFRAMSLVRQLIGNWTLDIGSWTLKERKQKNAFNQIANLWFGKLGAECPMSNVQCRKQQVNLTKRIGLRSPKLAGTRK